MKNNVLPFWEKYIAYLSSLNDVVARLITNLTRVNPRNISEVARATGLSPSLAHYHLKRLINKKLLKIRAKVNYLRIGLRPAEIFIDCQPNKRNHVLEVLLSNDYCRYVAPCFGRYNGFYLRATIPIGREVEFGLFLDEMVRHNLIKNYSLNWIDFIKDISRGFYWFNFKEKNWIFRWNDWIKEVLNSSINGINLKTYNGNIEFKPDFIDIFILKELEKNALVSFNEMAKKLNVTPPAIRYHYYQHVLRYGFINGYRPLIFPYPYVISDMFVFKVIFPNSMLMMKFINSLNGKPFATSVAKIAGRNELSVNIHLIKTEFLNFINSLLRMAESGIIQDFNYVLLDIKSYKHRTIPYECFINDRWVYNHKKYMQKIEMVSLKLSRIKQTTATK